MSEILAEGWRSGAPACSSTQGAEALAVTMVAEAEGFSLVENGFARDEPIARRLDLSGRQQQLNRISTGARV